MSKHNVIYLSKDTATSSMSIINPTTTTTSPLPPFPTTLTHTKPVAYLLNTPTDTSVPAVHHDMTAFVLYQRTIAETMQMLSIWPFSSPPINVNTKDSIDGDENAPTISSNDTNMMGNVGEQNNLHDSEVPRPPDSILDMIKHNWSQRIVAYGTSEYYNTDLYTYDPTTQYTPNPLPSSQNPRDTTHISVDSGEDTTGSSQNDQKTRKSEQTNPLIPQTESIHAYFLTTPLRHSASPTYSTAYIRRRTTWLIAEQYVLKSHRKSILTKPSYRSAVKALLAETFPEVHFSLVKPSDKRKAMSHDDNESVSVQIKPTTSTAKNDVSILLDDIGPDFFASSSTTTILNKSTEKSPTLKKKSEKIIFPPKSKKLITSTPTKSQAKPLSDLQKQLFPHLVPRQEPMMIQSLFTTTKESDGSSGIITLQSTLLPPQNLIETTFSRILRIFSNFSQMNQNSFIRINSAYAIAARRLRGVLARLVAQRMYIGYENGTMVIRSNFDYHNCKNDQNSDDSQNIQEISSHPEAQSLRVEDLTTPTPTNLTILPSTIRGTGPAARSLALPLAASITAGHGLSISIPLHFKTPISSQDGEELDKNRLSEGHLNTDENKIIQPLSTIRASLPLRDLRPAALQIQQCDQSGQENALNLGTSVVDSGDPAKFHHFSQRENIMGCLALGEAVAGTVDQTVVVDPADIAVTPADIQNLFALRAGDAKKIDNIEAFEQYDDKEIKKMGKTCSNDQISQLLTDYQPQSTVLNKLVRINWPKKGQKKKINDEQIETNNSPKGGDDSNLSSQHAVKRTKIASDHMTDDTLVQLSQSTQKALPAKQSHNIPQKTHKELDIIFNSLLSSQIQDDISLLCGIPPTPPHSLRTNETNNFGSINSITSPFLVKNSLEDFGDLNFSSYRINNDFIIEKTPKESDMFESLTKEEKKAQRALLQRQRREEREKKRQDVQNKREERVKARQEKDEKKVKKTRKIDDAIEGDDENHWPNHQSDHKNNSDSDFELEFDDDDNDNISQNLRSSDHSVNNQQQSEAAEHMAMLQEDHAISVLAKASVHDENTANNGQNHDNNNNNEMLAYAITRFENNPVDPTTFWPEESDNDDSYVPSFLSSLPQTIPTDDTGENSEFELDFADESEENVNNNAQTGEVNGEDNVMNEDDLAAIALVYNNPVVPPDFAPVVRRTTHGGKDIKTGFSGLIVRRKVSLYRTVERVKMLVDALSNDDSLPFDENDVKFMKKYDDLRRSGQLSTVMMIAIEVDVQYHCDWDDLDCPLLHNDDDCEEVGYGVPCEDGKVVWDFLLTACVTDDSVPKNNDHMSDDNDTYYLEDKNHKNMTQMAKNVNKIVNIENNHGHPSKSSSTALTTISTSLTNPIDATDSNQSTQRIIKHIALQFSNQHSLTSKRQHRAAMRQDIHSMVLASTNDGGSRNNPVSSIMASSGQMASVITQQMLTSANRSIINSLNSSQIVLKAPITGGGFVNNLFLFAFNNSSSSMSSSGQYMSLQRYYRLLYRNVQKLYHFYLEMQWKQVLYRLNADDSTMYRSTHPHLTTEQLLMHPNIPLRDKAHHTSPTRHIFYQLTSAMMNINPTYRRDLLRKCLQSTQYFWGWLSLLNMLYIHIVQNAVFILRRGFLNHDMLPLQQLFAYLRGIPQAVLTLFSFLPPPYALKEYLASLPAYQLNNLCQAMSISNDGENYDQFENTRTNSNQFNIPSLPSTHNSYYSISNSPMNSTNDIDFFSNQFELDEPLDFAPELDLTSKTLPTSTLLTDQLKQKIITRTQTSTILSVGGIKHVQLMKRRSIANGVAHLDEDDPSYNDSTEGDHQHSDAVQSSHYKVWKFVLTDVIIRVDWEDMFFHKLTCTVRW